MTSDHSLCLYFQYWLCCSDLKYIFRASLIQYPPSQACTYPIQDRHRHVYWKRLNILHLWCDFDRASSLICGNKMPTRCNRGSYCRSYCLFNMFRGPLCPSSELENHSTKYHRQQPLYNTLELLMMGIVVPETCWASNKICNKNLCCI